MITVDDVARELREIAAEHPNRVTMTGTCVYTLGGRPSCLVGHWLARHNVTVDEEGFINRTGWGDEVARELGLEITEDGNALLREAQGLQDSQVMWGVAVEKAIATWNRE